MKSIADRYAIILDNLKAMNQAHVLTFWDDLSEDKKVELLDQIESLDLNLLQKSTTLNLEEADSHHYQPGTLRPFDVIPLPKSRDDKKLHAEIGHIGDHVIKQGRVGVILVAGGQGTRLDFDGPKGMFPVGPITQRTLFQYHTEKIMALEKKYKTTIPVYIMTSEVNHFQTVDYFKTRAFFGKSPDTFIFFKQRMLPPLDARGKMILSDKGTISMAPDGHGGLLAALSINRILDDIVARRIDTLFYFQVDNVLTQICDPVFIGFHEHTKADISAKTIYKRSPGEKLGNIGFVENRIVTIEYTELSLEEKNRRDDNNRLVFGQGSIAIHIFSLRFLQRLIKSGMELPYHLAQKRIKYIDKNGVLVSPKKPNAYKFEQFIFDVFPLANDVMVLETDRKNDFSPIKNKTGEDSPQTARQDLVNLFGHRLEKCSYKPKKDSAGNVLDKIEISPLYAIDDEELKVKIDGRTLNSPILLE